MKYGVPTFAVAGEMSCGSFLLICGSSCDGSCMHKLEQLTNCNIVFGTIPKIYSGVPGMYNGGSAAAA